jgi:nitrate reductase beta subunit
MDEHGVHADPSKIQAIRDWMTLTTLTELYNFLGLAKFYHKFVLGFSHIAWSLSQVTKGVGKDKFVWYESRHKSFRELKHCYCSTSLPSLPDLQQPFEIKTDALDYVVGAALTQHGHPMSYYSETLYDAVRKYPTYDKEMYSIVQAYRQWKHYILRKETTIHTDHNTLQFIQT